jgi:DNA repair photolyase
MESVEEVDVLVICGILSELRTTSTLFTPLWVCYARPAHAYLNLSPGLDFETRIFHKPALAAVLARELSAPGYRCRVLHVGGNTDPYQPAERSLRSTRALLELLLERRHPLTIITKGALILRDIDLYVALAERRLVRVAVSLTSLTDAIKRTLEPLAASPRARLRVMQQLTAAGVPVSAMIAPVIPAITDHEIERMLEAVAAAAGVRRAGFLMLRLPFEVAGLFEAWLREHYPD